MPNQKLAFSLCDVPGLAVVAVWALAVLMACGGLAGPRAQGTDTPASTASALIGYWKSEMLRGQAISSGIFSLLELEATGTVDGNGGCNRIFGPYSYKDRVLRIGPVSATRRACRPEVMTQEQVFLGVLSEVRSFRYLQGEDALLLFSADGREIARFARVP